MFTTFLSLSLFLTVQDHLLKQRRYRYTFDLRRNRVRLPSYFWRKRCTFALLLQYIYRDPALRICHVHGFHPGKADRGEEKRLNPG